MKRPGSTARACSTGERNAWARRLRHQILADRLSARPLPVITPFFWALNAVASSLKYCTRVPGSVPRTGFSLSPHRVGGGASSRSPLGGSPSRPAGGDGASGISSAWPAPPRPTQGSRPVSRAENGASSAVQRQTAKPAARPAAGPATRNRSCQVRHDIDLLAGRPGAIGQDLPRRASRLAPGTAQPESAPDGGRRADCPDRPGRAR